MSRRAVAILSGGIDSSTLLFYIAKSNQYDEVHAITFIYGQKHCREIESAKKIANSLNVAHKIIDLSELKTLLASSLTSDDKEIPEVPSTADHYETLKDTVVPNRNAIFLSIAVGFAKSINASSIFYGAHYSDRGVYPDCRREFVESFQQTARLGTGDDSITVEAPFVSKTKSQIVEMGKDLGVPYDVTWSCYAGGERHCGKCSSCRERKRAFVEAEVPDPTEYAQNLRISEVFASVQGEGPNVGRRVVFLRTALCNLKCIWCDTRYTWDWKNYDYNKEVKEYDIGELESQITKFEIPHLVLTGGEPLIQQKSLQPLLRSLKEKHDVYIEVETNGTIKPTEELLDMVDQWNVSPKTSNSGNSLELRERSDIYELFAGLPNAFFKYVISQPSDIGEVEDLIEKYKLPKDRVLLMPEASTKDALIARGKFVDELAKKLGYRFTSRLQVELWGNQRGK